LAIHTTLFIKKLYHNQSASFYGLTRAFVSPKGFQSNFPQGTCHLLIQMCHEVLTITDLKAIREARGFSGTHNPIAVSIP
jgi:hypothetical protein